MYYIARDIPRNTVSLYLLFSLYLSQFSRLVSSTGAVVTGGEEVNQPKGHFTKDKKPKNFDVKQIFVSPSIKYSGHEIYANPKS